MLFSTYQQPYHFQILLPTVRRDLIKTSFYLFDEGERSLPPRFVDRPIQAMSMNIFRLCGDMSHVFSIIVLLLRLRVAKNASGELKEWIRRRWLCSFASLFFCCCCVGSDDIWPWTTAPETDCKMRTPQWRSIGTGIVSLRAAKEEAEAVWFATALSVDFRPGILYCKCEIFVFEGPEKAYWFHTCFSSSCVVFSFCSASRAIPL